MSNNTNNASNSMNTSDDNINMDMFCDKFLDIEIDDVSDNDNFFVATKNIANPCINRQMGIKEFLLPESFCHASFMLMKEIEKHNNDNLCLDGYIYPALYCFRQYLELTMKESIRRYKINYCNAKPKEVQFKSIHNLVELFKELKECKDIIRDFPSATINNVSRIIEEIQGFEKQVDFRYPFDYMKNGKMPDPSDRVVYNNLSQLYDMDNMKVMMQKLYKFFDGISNLAYIEPQYD
ncbi:MAG: hypothetical protein J5542_07760 [Bacteroidales bacterium]|nr:hypothetical protein [Bacteroidales bacterium]